MSFLFPPAEPTSLPIAGGGMRFPVRRVFCVGRNYAEHTREMGGDPEREAPFFFGKPADAVVSAVAGPLEVAYPLATQELEHEVELVVALERGGCQIDADQALSTVYGYAVGLDLTRRDLQRVAKAARRPWDAAKGFDASAPIGALVPAACVGHPHSGEIVLEVNGERRQEGDLAQMIFTVPEVIAALSELFVLHPGDLIFTGTPAGVGPLRVGDQLHARIEAVGELDVRIAAAHLVA